MIDAHAHIGMEWEELGIVVGFRRSIEVMDQYGIDIACCSASRSLRGDYRAGNQVVLQVMREYPGRVVGYAVGNPWFGRESVEAVRARIERDGMIGIKLHTAHVDVPYEHRLFDPFFELAAEMDVPMLVHSWQNCASLATVAERHPEVKIIAGHMGGPAWPDFVDLAWEHDNLYLEMCGTYQERRKIETTVERIGVERLLFGTDLPLIDPSVAIYAIQDAVESEDDRNKIFHSNAERLLKLSRMVK